MYLVILFQNANRRMNQHRFRQPALDLLQKIGQPYLIKQMIPELWALHHTDTECLARGPGSLLQLRKAVEHGTDPCLADIIPDKVSHLLQQDPVSCPCTPAAGRGVLQADSAVQNQHDFRFRANRTGSQPLLLQLNSQVWQRSFQLHIPSLFRKETDDHNQIIVCYLPTVFCDCFFLHIRIRRIPLQHLSAQIVQLVILMFSGNQFPVPEHILHMGGIHRKQLLHTRRQLFHTRREFHDQPGNILPIHKDIGAVTEDILLINQIVKRGCQRGYIMEFLVGDQHLECLRIQPAIFQRMCTAV